MGTSCQVYDLIKATSPWEDRDIQLELLTKLTGVAITQKEYGIVRQFIKEGVPFTLVLPFTKRPQPLLKQLCS